MKNVNLTSLVLIALSSTFLLLQSCQQEVDDVLPSQTNVSSKDPAKLSASLKVWHGTRTNGAPPNATGNTPVIDPTATPFIRAIAGRYAIIKPEVISGEIGGYYLAVQNSGQHFKIDFSKPRHIDGRFKNRKNNSIFQRPSSGNADSSIVIVLPSNINVPDTFCVTYWPYDPSGNIGQPVTTCIYVSSLGAGANNGWLQNDFRITSSWDVVNGIRENIDTVIYNKWAPYGEGYYCNLGSINYIPYLSGITPIVSDSLKYIKYNLRFAINGAFDYFDIEQEKFLDYAVSTCSQFVFKPIKNYSDSVIGGYSYNPVTQKLVFVFEFDYPSLPDPEYYEYDMIKITDNHFILRDPMDDYYIRFER